MDLAREVSFPKTVDADGVAVLEACRHRTPFDLPPGKDSPLKRLDASTAPPVSANAAANKDPWKAASQLDRIVPHWETKDENIWAIYTITDEAEWDPGEGRIVKTLEPELIKAFEQLARL
jgi:hypothetical protein